MKTKILILPLAAVLLLGACKGSGSGYQVDKRTSSTDTVAVATADTSASAKLVKTADMHFKVKNVQQTGENIAVLTAKYNGIVMHHQMQTSSERSQDIHISNDSILHVSTFNRVTDMTVNIPPANLEEFINQVSHMGVYVNSSKMDIDDKSLEYLSSKLKQDNKARFIAEEHQSKEKDAAKELTMKDDLVDSKINNLRIDKTVKLSTITLSFYESNSVVKEMVANDDPSAYQLPFFKRLGNALAYGWSLFAELLIGVLNLWVFILAGISVLLLIRFYRRKYSILADTIKS